MNTLPNNRLLFRPLSASDNAIFNYLYTNKKVMRYAGKTYRSKETNGLFKRQLQANQLAQSGGKKSLMTWVIINQRSKKTVGIVTLSFIMTDYNKNILQPFEQGKAVQAEAGVMLGLHAQGLGYGKEAVKFILGYGFNKMLLNKILAFYSSENVASATLFKQLGFIKPVGYRDKNPTTCCCYLTSEHYKLSRTLG
jgi:ribosomal-protein-alanine N-acetyltransferase